MLFELRSIGDIPFGSVALFCDQAILMNWLVKCFGRKTYANKILPCAHCYFVQIANGFYNNLSCSLELVTDTGLAILIVLFCNECVSIELRIFSHTGFTS